MDPFGFYVEGIQQRLDDAFVEGDASSQGGGTEQGSPLAEATPPVAEPDSNPDTKVAAQH